MALEDFIIRLHQPGLLWQGTVRPACFFFPAPVHKFTQAFNGFTVVYAFVKAYMNGLYQGILVIARHHAQDHFQIVPVISFLFSLEVLHPQGDLPVSGYIDKDAFGQLPYPGTLRPSVSFIINRFPFAGTEDVPGDDFSRLLAV